MERGTPFCVDQIYHVYTRGVEKRIVFLDTKDSERMRTLLSLANSTRAVRSADVGKKISRGLPSRKVAGELLTGVIAYALMPNHMHLILRETRPGGISKFMHKTMTAYSMYFNTKYERSGPLFTRPFRSRHVDSDEYMRWLFAYVSLNPLDLHQGDWKKRGIQDLGAARGFMHGYRYSSFPDYFGQTGTDEGIVQKDALPFQFDGTMDTLLRELSEQGGPYEQQSTL